MDNKEPKDVDLEQELEDLYRKVANTDTSGDSSYPLQQLKTETAAPEGLGLPEHTNDCPVPRKTSRFLLMAIGAFFPLTILCLVAIFFWPTIYNYESLKIGEKVYPIRTNILTGESLYFNGAVWLTPPFDNAIKKPTVVNMDKSSAITTPETTIIKAQPGESTAAPSSLNTHDKGLYVIQIKAFPEKNKKDADAFIEDVKRKIPDIQMKTTHIAGHGVWYRIWVGNFSSMKEASNTMKILKLSESYPGSFIRTQSGE
ncbi:MAG TPA: hypothetical protein DCG53_01995 [Syntrophus sp. (in: bacteria)]|nr:hypothetical protein [Syntrophus sp. (in: bacteria)]